MEEEELLTQYVMTSKRRGRKWKAIAHELQRTPQACKNKWVRLWRDNLEHNIRRQTHWTPLELEQLQQGWNATSHYRLLSERYARISRDFVPTRTWEACGRQSKRIGLKRKGKEE
jgi:hypothetical protein